MTPASVIVQRFGGATAVARIVGVHRTRIYTWLRSGRVPQAHQLKLLSEAQQRGVPLTAEELIGAKPRSERAA